MYSMPKCGLYAITQTENKSIQMILDETNAVLNGGAVVVQYRDKSPINAEKLAKELVDLCHLYHVPLIVNDDVLLAKKVLADGVHLGKDDDDISQARELLGNSAIIGMSCYNSLESAVLAQQRGANYIAFGRFFPSSSKPLAEPAQIETLLQAKQQLIIPIIAIGGILPNNGKLLLDAGADLLAVIGGLFQSHNPKQAALDYCGLFNIS